MLQLEDKIKSIVAERLKVNINEINMESLLFDDLGADSLNIVEIIMDLEQEFNITIPDQENKNLSTIRNIVDYIKKRA